MGVAASVPANAPNNAAQSSTAAPSIASRRSQSSSRTDSSRSGVSLSALAVLIAVRRYTGVCSGEAIGYSCRDGDGAASGRQRAIFGKRLGQLRADVEGVHALMPTISRNISILTKSVRP